MNFQRKILYYSNDHIGKTQTRDQEMSIDPGPQNTFWAFFQNYMYLLYRSQFLTDLIW